MAHIADIIEKFEGVIGALLGVAMTLILTQFLKSFGKLSFYVIEVKINFEKNNDSLYGDREDTDKLHAQFTSIKSKIEIFNNSDIPKIIRNVRFCFYENNIFLFSTIPENQETARSNGHWVTRDALYNLNIPQKQIIDIDVVDNIRTR